MECGDNETVTSPDLIHASRQNDQNHTTQMNSVEQRFPIRLSLIKPEIRDFGEVQHRLSTDRAAMMEEL